MKKLKILLLTDRLALGGAETHILTLYNALTARGHYVIVASSGGTLSTCIRHVNIDLCSRSPLSLLRGYFRLRSLILSEGFDVVHAHARIPSLIASLALHGLSLPLLTTVHARFRANGMRRRLSHWGYAAVAVSHDLRDALLSTC